MIIVEKDTQATVDNITKWINKHKELYDKFDENHNYYNGKHKILKDENENKTKNTPIINLAKYITTMATNYLVGEKVEYSYKGETAKDTFDTIMDLYKRQSMSLHDNKMAKTASISGLSYELTYLSSDEHPVPKTAMISEYDAEIICDNTIENNCLYGLHFFEIDDNKAIVEVYDNTFKTTYVGGKNFVNLRQHGKPEPHGIDRVPITELINNEELQGDFEQNIKSIDAYEKIFAEQIDDIEEFNDAILMLYNTNFYQGDQKVFEDRRRQLKKDKILEFTSNDQSAGWLTKIMDQSKISVLASALRADIHATSFVPNMTDVNFANNSSGVAMQYKLIGFEALTKEKQSYFEKCLRRRLKMFASALSLNGKSEIDVQDITITFKRDLPRNDAEIAQIISQVDGRNIVDKETLGKQLSFYNEDVKEKLEEEARNNPQTDYASLNNPNMFSLGGFNGI